jgi:hypothetical protein
MHAHSLPATFEDQLVRFARAARRWTFVNCWHANEHESAAMWKLYAKSEEAIAIQTTFKRLCEVLPETVYVGLVHYVDFDSFEIPSNNTMWPYVFKRLSFEYEREVRAMFQDFPIRDDQLDLSAEPEGPGKHVEVALSDLVETVYVAPFTSDWYFELVGRVTQRYGYDFRMAKSGLATDPVV